MKLHIEPNRKKVINEKLWEEHLWEMENKLNERKKVEKIYPPENHIFEVYNRLPENEINEIKVVILGQDPYHGEWQAHGLSFSVPDGVKLPPSLKNIKKEVKDDVGWKMNESGDLTEWVNQWVFLLNSVLTVAHWNPWSHAKLGRQEVTDVTIQHISDKNSACVFLLWWSYAQKKAVLVDKRKHLIISSPHPSPLSAYRWFFWSKPFSTANKFLLSHWKTQVDW